jgi:hypothetical protein
MTRHFHLEYQIGLVGPRCDGDGQIQLRPFHLKTLKLTTPDVEGVLHLTTLKDKRATKRRIGVSPPTKLQSELKMVFHPLVLISYNQHPPESPSLSTLLKRKVVYCQWNQSEKAFQEGLVTLP